jgi:hypothetical protein
MNYNLNDIFKSYFRLSKSINNIDNLSAIVWYQQRCRIYLDEYEVEEVDLRVNFDTSLLMKRFMVKE